MVTYAQAWHWTDPKRAVPEAWRVLRPGGVLALWWNDVALDIPWIAAQEGRIARHFDGDPLPRPPATRRGSSAGRSRGSRTFHVMRTVGCAGVAP
ncbi:hypothetical protein GCM10020000_04790 [Streptomyces olivoverticillatus]